jgi:hypothetical protein
MPPFRSLYLLLAALSLLIVLATAAHTQINPFSRGFSRLTADDLRLIEDETGTLLERGQAGSVASWQNEDSGNFGTMELEWSFQNEGVPCARVDHVIKFRGEADPRLFQLTYCRIGETWKLAE